MRKIFTLLLVCCTLLSYSQSTTLVISQFYGAGGNTGATLNADYVELHNISGSAVSLTGMTIQYSSATNTGVWTGITALPTASIPAGGYYLIQMGAAGAVGAPLPTPDYFANPTIAMSGTSGKLALVANVTPLTGCVFPSADVIDGVGYGTANCAEGTATAVLTPTSAGLRNNNGCDETDNNLADFTITTPAPRNSASPVFTCTTTTNPTLTAGTVVDFGSVVILTNSTSQSFNVSGINLTGGPGVITITAPSTDFQVSNNNSVWGASTTIPYAAATLAATQVWVRFTPQTIGPKSGNVTVTGGGATSVNVPVSGNGVSAATPNVSSSALSGFGNVCVGTAGGPNSITITGTNLTTADLVIGALAGYSYSLTSGGTYTPTLNISHPAGSLTQTVFVQFLPTAVQSYNGNITVTGGGISTPVSIPVTGAGIAGAPTATTGAASAITQTTATVAGTIPSIGCSPVTAYGFEYSLVSGFTNGTVVASTNLSGTAFSAGMTGLTASTTYYYKAFATNASGTVYGMEMSFTTQAGAIATLSASTLAAFNSTCVSQTSGPNSFDLTGANLTAGDITIGPLTGFSFSTTSTGTYAPTLTLPASAGAFTGTVYVNFTPPAVGNYNGSIPVSGAGVAAFGVDATATGSNSLPVVLTNNADSIMANSATARGSQSGAGCSAILEMGIEYSGINGFADGYGTRVPATSISGADFSSRLTRLVSGATYFYKAYVRNAGGTAYGAQNSFTTKSLPDGLIIYGTPIVRGQNLHYSLKGLKLGHYSIRIHNAIGQRVMQRDIVIQTDFIDDNFILPGNLPVGFYNLEIRNYEYYIQKSFWVQ